MGKTLFDKIWDTHVVREDDSGTCLLYIDRHLVHEVTSPQAFSGLQMAHREMWRAKSIMAVPDHNVPTIDRDKEIEDPVSRAQIERLDSNAADFGLDYFDQDIDSLIVSGAISVSKAISLSRGVLIPQIDFSYLHEFENDENSLNSLIAGASLGSTFLVEADDPDVNYGSAGVGLVFVGANGKQAYLTYRSILGLSGFSRWTVNAGFRFEF